MDLGDWFKLDRKMTLSPYINSGFYQVYCYSNVVHHQLYFFLQNHLYHL